MIDVSVRPASRVALQGGSQASTRRPSPRRVGTARASGSALPPWAETKTIRSKVADAARQLHETMLERLLRRSKSSRRSPRARHSSRKEPPVRQRRRRRTASRRARRRSPCRSKAAGADRAARSSRTGRASTPPLGIPGPGLRVERHALSAPPPSGSRSPAGPARRPGRGRGRTSGRDRAAPSRSRRAGCRARSRRRPGRWRRAPTGRRGRSSRLGAERERLDDVAAAADPAVEQDLDLVADRLGDRGQRADRGRACRRGCCRRGWTPRSR